MAATGSDLKGIFELNKLQEDRREEIALTKILKQQAKERKLLNIKITEDYSIYWLYFSCKKYLHIVNIKDPIMFHLPDMLFTFDYNKNSIRSFFVIKNKVYKNILPNTTSDNTICTGNVDIKNFDILSKQLEEIENKYFMSYFSHYEGSSNKVLLKKMEKEFLKEKELEYLFNLKEIYEYTLFS